MTLSFNTNTILLFNIIHCLASTLLPAFPSTFKQFLAMSEIGEEGHSLSSEGGSPKGSDGSATKSPKGKGVQFANEGGRSKGEKKGKAPKGGNIPMWKEPEPSDIEVGQELPENIKCLMNCEAIDILQGIQERMVMFAMDSNIKFPESFAMTLKNAKSLNNYTNSKSVRSIIEPLADYGVSDSEMCVIANVCPETVDEVFAFVPSLEDKRSNIDVQVLKDVLSELAKLKAT